MSKPKLLDLFCCEGGASEGYRRAGFDVYGVDLFKHNKTDADGNPVLDKRGKPVRVGFSRERYPFPAVQGDVFEVVGRLIDGVAWFGAKDGKSGEWLGIGDFAAIHASPPCQHASAGTRAMRAQGTSEHPALIEPTRELLNRIGLPWVIENVKGAALRWPILLCGSMFGLQTEDEDGFPLRLERHRLFEASVPLMTPGPCRHDPKVWAAGVYGGARGRRPGQTAAEHRHASRYDRHGGYVPTALEVQQRLLGIDWMTKGGMAQSLPPVYCQDIGMQLMAHIEAEAAA